jgi:hypothetical protein
MKQQINEAKRMQQLAGLVNEAYVSPERIYIGKPVESGPLATASDYLYNMEKVLMQLEKIVDKNPNSDISAKQVITLVLNTLKKIRDKQTN